MLGLLFILCALCPPNVSKVHVGQLTPYAIETLRNIRDFLDVKFIIKPDPNSNTHNTTTGQVMVPRLAKCSSCFAKKSSTFIKFGVLFNDDRCANIFEALVGTLRAANKRKFVIYDGELLLQGVHDNVEITLLPPLAVTAA